MYVSEPLAQTVASEGMMALQCSGCLQLRESCAVHHCCRLLRFLAVRAGQLQLPALGPPYPKPSPSDQVPDNLSGHPLPDHSPSGVVPPVP